MQTRVLVCMHARTAVLNLYTEYDLCKKILKIFLHSYIICGLNTNVNINEQYKPAICDAKFRERTKLSSRRHNRIYVVCSLYEPARKNLPPDGAQRLWRSKLADGIVCDHKANMALVIARNY